MCKCKRCGRELRSEESVKRGFGKRCYRIVQLNQESEETITPDITELFNRLRRLELDNNFIKHQLKHKTFTTTKHPDEDLDWNTIKPEIKEKRDYFKIEFNVVIKELKVIFNENFDYHDFLKPINVRKQPEEPPLMLDVSQIELLN